MTIMSVLGSAVLIEIARYNHETCEFDREGVKLLPFKPAGGQYDPGESDFKALYANTYELRQWDEGYGPLWLYRESLGPVGVVRATSWEEAWEAVVDEILDDADETDPENLPDEDGNLPEGVYFRGSGVPSNPGLNSSLACEDLNGSSLDLLTPELARECRVTVYIVPEEGS